MRVGPHSHPCAHCKTPVECEAELVRNYDGWPEVVCEDYHLVGGATNPDWLCEDCQECDALRDRKVAN